MPQITLNPYRSVFAGRILSSIMDAFSLAKAESLRKKSAAAFMHWLHILHVAHWFFESLEDILREVVETNSLHRDVCTNADALESTSVSQAPRVTQSDGSSKRKERLLVLKTLLRQSRRQASHFVDAKIEMSSAPLSRAVGEDMNDKHMRLNEEIMKNTTLATTERREAARLILADNALVSYFFSLPDGEKDEWVRALLHGDI